MDPSSQAGQREACLAHRGMTTAADNHPPGTEFRGGSRVPRSREGAGIGELRSSFVISLNPLGKNATILVMIDIDRRWCPGKVEPGLGTISTARRKLLGDLSSGFVSLVERIPRMGARSDIRSSAVRATRVQILQSNSAAAVVTVAVKKHKRGVPPPRPHLVASLG